MPGIEPARRSGPSSKIASGYLADIDERVGSPNLSAVDPFGHVLILHVARQQDFP
jgi:hypothetical protein